MININMYPYFAFSVTHINIKYITHQVVLYCNNVFGASIAQQHSELHPDGCAEQGSNSGSCTHIWKCFYYLIHKPGPYIKHEANNNIKKKLHWDQGTAGTCFHAPNWGLILEPVLSYVVL